MPQLFLGGVGQGAVAVLHGLVGFHERLQPAGGEQVLHDVGLLLEHPHGLAAGQGGQQHRRHVRHARRGGGRGDGVTALPADFATARSVAAAYLAAWCYQPAEQPANTNLRNAAGWMTAAGWADDSSRAVDEPSWARTQAAGVSTVCGPATASVSPQGPNSPTATWVTVTAQQARVRGGALIGQSPVSMMRRVLQAPDGRWLVDVRVMAG